MGAKITGFKPSMISIIIFAAFALLICVSGCKETECPDCICPNCPDVVCPRVEWNSSPEMTVVTQYVCPDDRIVEDPSECKQAPLDFSPVMTNEGGTAIGLVEIKPSCIMANPGGLIHYRVGSIPDKVTVQVSEGQEYREIYSKKGALEDFIDFTVCLERCPWAGDFQLDQDKAYLMRVEFDFTSIYNEKQYSNEHIVDARQHSEYTTKVCKSG